MKKAKTKIVVAISCVIVLFFTSCITSTRVHINSEVEGTEVYIDGQKVGVTPLTVDISNAIWEDQEVILKADGYKTRYADLKKEVKPVNAVCGVLFWWPSLLWCYGPKANQYYLMFPVEETNVPEVIF